MRTESKQIKKGILRFSVCLLLMLLAAAVLSAAAESDASATAETNGIPVVSLTIDPEELQKVNESPDHSYRAPGGTLRIDVPEGYKGEFGGISADTGEIRAKGNALRVHRIDFLKTYFVKIINPFGRIKPKKASILQRDE